MKRKTSKSRRLKSRRKRTNAMPTRKKPVAKKAVARDRKKTAEKRPRARRAVTVAAWDPDSMSAAIDSIWDQPDSSHMTNCASNIPQPNRDCNCFLKNAARGFFTDAQPFDDQSKGADDIIAILADSSSAWTEIGNPDGNGTQRTADAIQAFNSDQKVVIAGMTSGELGDTNGHLALVVKGTETAGSANLVVPKCTAGSQNAVARVKDKGVNWSFGKTMPRQVRYFYKAPDTSSSFRPRKGRRSSKKTRTPARVQRI